MRHRRLLCDHGFGRDPAGLVRARDLVHLRLYPNAEPEVVHDAGLNDPTDHILWSSPLKGSSKNEPSWFDDSGAIGLSDR